MATVGGHHANGYHGGLGGDRMDSEEGQAQGDYQDAGDFKLEDPPVPRIPQDTFEAVRPFAGPYKSIFTSKPPAPAKEVLDCLKHVNCSYLSSGVPPSLLLLKQHAQSLTVLIREMTVSQTPSLIDNENAGLPGVRPFNANESFDWLNNLMKPYTTDQLHHLQPLTSVLNMVEQSPIREEDRNICPLQTVVDEGAWSQTHPWANHESLIRHANEVLERLDHEYSARGGLLSIFPTNMEKSDREKAEKTVLGQMILWVQNLVQRVHNLERLYANAMDLLAKEAAVPTETLTSLGTRGRKGREVVYPQDRFVLVNAGDDLWDFLNAEFERKEIIDTAVDKNYRDLGTTGEAIWAQRGGREFAKGITCIDVYTRYYRLRDNPLKTVFVIPAYEIHPGTKVTREMEQQPTVVSVVKPVWPERMSVLETKHKNDMAVLKQLQNDVWTYESKIADKDRDIMALTHEYERLKQQNRLLAKKAEDTMAALKQDPNEFKLRGWEETTRAAEARSEAARMRAMYEKQVADHQAALATAKATAEEMKNAREKLEKDITAHKANCEEECARKSKELDDRDADIARAAQTVVSELKKVWLKQVTETQILIEFVNSPDMQKALKDVVIPEHITKLGTDIAKKLHDDAVKNIPDTVPRNKPEESSSEESESSKGGRKAKKGGRLDKVPKKASWRKASRGSFSSSVPRSPQNVHFDVLGKPKTGDLGATDKSPKSAGSTPSFSSGYNIKSSIHGSPKNPYFVALGKGPSEGTGSGGSMKKFAGGSPGSGKKVGFSPTMEQGPTSSGSASGAGSQKHSPTFDRQEGSPNKKAKATSKTPGLTAEDTEDVGQFLENGNWKRRGIRGNLRGAGVVAHGAPKPRKDEEVEDDDGPPPMV